MVSTKCHAVTEIPVTGCQNSSDNYSRTPNLGGQETLVLLMVVLVPFNCMITMALEQLGIWNNYSKNLSLWNHQGSSDEPRAGWPDKPSHEVTWVVSGKPIRYYQTNRIQSLEPSRLQYLYFLRGAGSLLGIDCACMSHELLKHMDQHSWSSQQWVPISSIPRAPTDTAGGLEGTKRDGKTSSTRISVTHILR